MSKNKRYRWQSAERNNQTYFDYLHRLKNLAINSFKWENVPDTINIEYLERQFFEKGYCIFFYDDVLGYLCLSGSFEKLDVYGEPTRYTAIGADYNNSKLNNNNSVIMWNNYLHLPTYITIEQYAYRLYEIERSIDVNIKSQKTPIMIIASEQQRLTMQNLYMQYDGNEPFIFGNKDLDLTGIQSLNTNAPFVSDKLEILKHQIWNEALTYLGIENSNQDKRERLVADEVSSNYGNVEAQRKVFLNARENAVDKINKMFDLDIKVSFNSEISTMVNEPNLIGGINSEQIYNTINKYNKYGTIK